jgi:hypothetical protein
MKPPERLPILAVGFLFARKLNRFCSICRMQKGNAELLQAVK